MSRISSFAVNAQLVSRLLNTQQNLLDGQAKITTEKESQDYAGIALDSQRLINIENSKGRLERYIRNNESQETRLGVASTAVEAIRTSITNFRRDLTEYSLGEPLVEANANAIQESAFRALRDMEDLLNTEVDGRFLFAGSRATTAPVNLGFSSVTSFQQTFDGARIKAPETRDAHLESLTFNNDRNNENSVFIDDTKFLRFERDSSDSDTNTGSSTIQASSALFSQLTAGSTVEITNSSSNNGSYTVSSVSSDGTTVTINTEMFTDETIVGSLTTETPAGAVSFLLESDTSGTASLVGGAGATSFDATTNVIESTNGTFFSALSAGDHVTVSGSGSNNFTVRIASVSTNGSAITIDGDGTGLTLADGTVLTNVHTGQLAFSRANDTIVAANAVFSGVSVGERITVSGSDENNGTYTVSAVSSDGKTVTVNSTKLTDEGISRDGFFTNFNGEDIIYSDTQFNFSTAGTITVNRLNTSATIGVEGVFSSLVVGTTFTIAGASDAGNNTTYTVTSISGDGSQVAVSPVPTTTNVRDQNAISVTPGASSSMQTYYTQTQLAFTDSTNTIAFQTSTGGSVAGAFTGLTVGQQIKLSGSPYDDTYTIASIASDGSSITVNDPNGTITADATDTTEVQIQALPTNTYFNMRNDTDVFFNSSTNTIEVRRSGSSTALTNAETVPDIFNGLAVGQQFTIGGAANTAMNTTYTVASISADGSSITTTESITTTVTDTDGITFTGSGNSFSYTSSTQVRYIDATNTIEIEDSSGTNVANAFDGLIAGQTITLTGGTYAGSYVISSVSSDKSSIVVADPNNTISADAVDTSEINLQVFSASGTISANSYYQGDDLSLTHRVDDDRSFDFDIQANDPAFEKAIRAMKLILQGEYGTEGGLDNNQSRVNDALYLLNSALEETVTGTPPFGTEQTGSIESVERDIGFDRFLINEINQTHTSFIGFLDQSIANIENADPLETLTRLLDDERALNASYQTFSRIRQLSLTNFL